MEGDEKLLKSLLCLWEQLCSQLWHWTCKRFGKQTFIFRNAMHGVEWGVVELHGFVWLGILQSQKTIVMCSIWRTWNSVWCGWGGQFESDHPFHICPALCFCCFRDCLFAPRPAGQGSLRIGRGCDAMPASRLNPQMSRPNWVSKPSSLGLYASHI